ncbi:MAG TPA: SGNH/GDSL hydrolase family protein, partial [Pyrinomonadaceae bacterium]
EQQQQQQSSQPPPRTPRVPEGEFVSNVIEIARLARDRGARALVVGTVYRDAVTNPPEAARIRGHRDLLRSATQVHGVDYLDIPELTEANHPHTKKLFGELIHPNHEGHRVFADALLKHFAARNTLPGLSVPQSL